MATQNPDKTMSSRLMTMKFMQRSAVPRNVNLIQESQLPCTKRQNLEEDFSKSQGKRGADAIRPIEDASQLKRRRILNEQATEAGDSKWELNQELLPGAAGASTLNIINVGFGAIDTNDQSQTGSNAGSITISPIPASFVCRKSYGNFKSSIEKSQNHTAMAEARDENGSPTSSCFSEQSDTEDGAAQVDQAVQLKGKRQENAGKTAERRDTAIMAGRQRNEASKLRKLSSISSGGGSNRLNQRSTLRTNGDASCYMCGERGHKKKDCPKLHR